MKCLEDYSYDEIKKEYWKRRSAMYPTKKAKWFYWKARVIEVTISDKKNSRFFDRYLFKVVPIESENDIYDVVKNKTFFMNAHSDFRADTKPKIGDIVLLRYRNHIHGIDFPDESKIIEVVKRI